ncbi:MAG TPA: hypothetical protein VF063_00610 [Gaiellaceae bacterium]
MSARRFLLLSLVTALSVTALIAILAVLGGAFGDTEWKVLATTGGFALASLFAMRGTILLDQGRNRDVGWAVVGLSALAFLLELKVVWIDDGNSEVTWKALAISAGFAGALGQIATSLARRRPSDPPTVRPLSGLAGACALLVEAMIAYAAIAEVSDGDYYRFLGAVFILDVLLFTLESMVRRLGARPVVEPGHAAFVCVLADGRQIRREAREHDVPIAVADALTELAAKGERVRSIELER